MLVFYSNISKMSGRQVITKRYVEQDFSQRGKSVCAGMKYLRVRAMAFLTVALALVTLVFVTLVTVRPAEAQIDLIIDVIDTVAEHGAKNTPISVFIDNFNDSIAGVELWLQLDRPDAIIFQTDIDTVNVIRYWKCNDGAWPSCNDSSQVFDTVLYWRCLDPAGAVPPSCVDSIQVLDPDQVSWDYITLPDWDFFTVIAEEITRGNFDTSGTLLSGWEFVTSSSLGGKGVDIKISAIANQSTVDPTPGFGPQFGQGGLLIKLLADVIIAENDTDRVVGIRIISTPLDQFSFSDENGQSIGIVTDSVFDSTLWFCDQWVGEDCLGWTVVPTAPFDSVSTQWVLRGVLDTDVVILFDGSVTIAPKRLTCCDLAGDANDNGSVNIADAIYLINRVFGSPAGPAPPCCEEGDANGNNSINIADAIYIINRVFGSPPGPAPVCGVGPYAGCP